MNQAMAALVVAMGLSGLWRLGRPRPRLLAFANSPAVAALNRAQLELVPAPAVVPGEAAARPESPLVAIPALGASQGAAAVRTLAQGALAGRTRRLTPSVSRLSSVGPSLRAPLAEAGPSGCRSLSGGPGG